MVDDTTLVVNADTNKVGIGVRNATSTLQIVNDGSTGGLSVIDSSSAKTTQFIVDESGRVGIGTAAPTSRIYGYVDNTWNSSNPAFTFYNSDGGTGNGNTVLIRGGASEPTSYSLTVQDWNGNTDFHIRGD